MGHPRIVRVLHYFVDARCAKLLVEKIMIGDTLTLIGFIVIILFVISLWNSEG